MRNFVNLADIDNKVQQANMNDLRIADAIYGQKMNQRAMEQQDRALRDAEVVRGITREVGGDLKTLRDRLYQEGYLDQATAIDKQIGEREKTSLGNEKSKLENAKTRIGIFGSGANFIAQNPTKENAIMVFSNMRNAGVIDDNQFNEYTAQIPDDPALIKNGAMALVQQALDAKDQLEKTETINAGGKQITQAINPVSGAVRKLGSIDVTMTPYQEEQNKIARGNLNVSRERLNFDKQGGVTAVNAKSGGATGTGGNTKGQEAVDKEFAKEYVAFKASGGYADTSKQLSQLRDAAKDLETDSTLTGPIRGMAPDAVRSFTNPKAVEVKNAVEEVVQRNLRLVLGAQFTEKEGERLIARAFNERLSPKENAKRVNRLITQIDKAAKAKEDAANYFEKNGTLTGWQGKNYSIQDFDVGGDVPAGNIIPTGTAAGTIDKPSVSNW